MQFHYFTFLDTYENEIFRVDGFLFQTPLGYVSVDEFDDMVEWGSLDEFVSHMERLHCFTFEITKLQ